MDETGQNVQIFEEVLFSSYIQQKNKQNKTRKSGKFPESRAETAKDRAETAKDRAETAKDRPETLKILKERFLFGRNRTKRANFRGSPLFQATYNIKTEEKTNN